MKRGQIGAKSHPRSAIRPATLHTTWDGRHARLKNDDRLPAVETLDAVHRAAEEYYDSRGVLGTDQVKRPKKFRRRSKVELDAAQRAEEEDRAVIEGDLTPEPSAGDVMQEGQISQPPAAKKRRARSAAGSAKSNRQAPTEQATKTTVMIRKLDQSALFAIGVVLEEYVQFLTRSAYRNAKEA